MFDFRILLRATAIGVAVHIGVVVAETIFPSIGTFIGLLASMYLVMMIAGLSGFLYARSLNKGFSAGALGGLVAGMVSVFSGLALAMLLNGAPAFPVGLGTVIGTAIGAIGGVFGEMSANMRKAAGKS